MDIINLSRAELSALMATTVQPTCVNIPEELIRCIPSYVRHRVRFVNCRESVCDYATPALMLQGYYDGHVDRDAMLRTFDEASVCHVVCDVTGMITLGGE